MVETQASFSSLPTQDNDNVMKSENFLNKIDSFIQHGGINLDSTANCTSH